MRHLNVTSLSYYRIALSLVVPVAVAVFMSDGRILERAALAQGHSQPPASGPGPAAPRPMGPMGPGVGPQRPIPGQADLGGVRGPVQELKIDPVKLPANYSPPPVKSEIMELDAPLALQDELDKLKKELTKYQNVLRGAKSTDADKIQLRLGLRYRLGMMCLKENRSQLPKLREELLRDLNNNNTAAAPDLKATQVTAFRQLVLQELLAMATPLLTTQNFYVRLHIALLIGELNLTEESPKLGLKQEAFSPALDPLIKVIVDDKQPDAIKVVAVNGIVRLLRTGSTQFNLRTQVAQALVSELLKKDGHPWYQMRLAGAMAAVDVNLDDARKPFVVNALTTVLGDDERTWLVRAEAAKSLGRVPLPGSVNPETITRAVAGFALKLTKAAQQAPQQKADDPRWRAEFIRVYLAFQPMNAEEQTADKKSKAGLLNNDKAAAKPAYDLILPLVVAILHGQRLAVQQVQQLEAWVSPSPPGTQPAQSANQPKSTQDAPKLADPMTVGGRK